MARAQARAIFPFLHTYDGTRYFSRAIFWTSDDFAV